MTDYSPRRTSTQLKVKHYTGRVYLLYESSEHWHIVSSNRIPTALRREECTVIDSDGVEVPS